MRWLERQEPNVIGHELGREQGAERRCNRSLRIRTLMAISRRLMGDNKRSFAGSSRADLAAELSFGRSVKNQSKCPFGKPHLSGGPPARDDVRGIPLKRASDPRKQALAPKPGRQRANAGTGRGQAFGVGPRYTAPPPIHRRSPAPRARRTGIPRSPGGLTRTGPVPPGMTPALGTRSAVHLTKAHIGWR